MELKLPGTVHAYFCPGCSGKVRPAPINDQPQHLRQWQCSICLRKFSRPWSTFVWGNQAGVSLSGLEPWTPWGPSRLKIDDSDIRQLPAKARKR